jgi:hypothetical protein
MTILDPLRELLIDPEAERKPPPDALRLHLDPDRYTLVHVNSGRRSSARWRFASTLRITRREQLLEICVSQNYESFTVVFPWSIDASRIIEGKLKSFPDHKTGKYTPRIQCDLG